MKVQNSEFTNGFCMLCEMTKRKYSEALHDFYLSELKPLGLERVLPVILAFARDCRFPSVNEIKERLGVVTALPDEDQKARVFASEVWSAIEKFGGYRIKDAAEHFGPEKWRVVTAFGSWPQICEILTDDKPNFLAQFREFAKAYRLNDAYESQTVRLSSGATNIVAELASSVDRTVRVKLLD